MTAPLRAIRRAMACLLVFAGVLAGVLVGSSAALAEEVPGAPVASQAPSLQANAPSPESVGSNVPWLQQITSAASAYGVDAHLLQAVVAVESNFDSLAVSRSGAIGLMQIMPLTAVAVAGLRGTPQSLRQQLQDPTINVHAGALYLRSLMDTFTQRLDLALAAYNAGAGNVRKAGNRVPANGETPRFVKKVTDLYASIKAAARLPEPDAAMQEPPTPLGSQ